MKPEIKILSGQILESQGKVELYFPSRWVAIRYWVGYNYTGIGGGTHREVCRGYITLDGKVWKKLSWALANRKKIRRWSFNNPCVGERK